MPSEELYFDQNGTLTLTRQLLYDKYDNLVETIIIDGRGTNTLFKKKFDGKLLVEKITYAPTFGFVEWTVTRYEYSRW